MDKSVNRAEVIRALKIEQECITRNWVCNCNRDCGSCDLVQETDYLLKVYEAAINFLKEEGS